VPYVALVASEVRGQAVRESLDLSDEDRARLHTPAGLEIGAESPEEIAVAILAEIVALRPSEGSRAVTRPSLGETAASEQDRRAEEVPAEPTAAPAPVVISTETAVDPVCGMEVAVSEASIHLERGGELHYFCSEGCRDTFSAERIPDGAS
jgi:xanthine dehydrogenase accessory factor